MVKKAFRVPGDPAPWPTGIPAGYHITHIGNLRSIVDAGALKCDNVCDAESISKRSIAYDHIKQRRNSTRVKVAQGGTIGDYVPFYYAPRSPMLFTIDKGNVEGHEGGQNPIVHLVIAVPEIAVEGEFVITDGHAAMPISQQFEDLDALREIDWPVMRGRYWQDTDEHGDRKRRRQAELLVHGQVPFERVRLIGVFDQAALEAAEAVIDASPFDTEIRIRKDWYY